MLVHFVSVILLSFVITSIAIKVNCAHRIIFNPQMILQWSPLLGTLKPHRRFLYSFYLQLGKSVNHTNDIHHTFHYRFAITFKYQNNYWSRAYTNTDSPILMILIADRVLNVANHHYTEVRRWSKRLIYEYDGSHPLLGNISSAHRSQPFHLMRIKRRPRWLEDAFTI